MGRLAELTSRFGQNVLGDEAAFGLSLQTEADRAGLPYFVCAALQQAAHDRGIEAALLVTLSRSHIAPFLTFSERRDLREQAWRAWTTRGEHSGERDNRPIAQEILALRIEQAQLRGYESYADYALIDTMAGRQSAVTTLLEQVWEPAKARAAQELDALNAMARSCGETFALEPWDWRYYAEKVRHLRHDLVEATVKPYFPLERMVGALFDCAQRLFGITFTLQPQIRAHHPDVNVYEVRAADATPIGVFLHDNFARASKRSGAWMSAFRLQSRNGDERAMRRKRPATAS